MKTGTVNYMLTLAFLLFPEFCVFGQGTVNFANIGEGVNAPITYGGIYLGAGFTAQLQFPDGTNIGDPAPFLANGLFSGGSRTVPGIAGGETATLQIFISNADGSLTVTLPAMSVTLANPDALPEPEAPAPLLGLTAFDFRIANEAAPEFSTGLPEPNPTIPSPATIIYHLSDDRVFSLKWPIGKQMYGSSKANRASKVTINPTRRHNGWNVKIVDTRTPQFFFWLEGG